MELAKLVELGRHELDFDDADFQVFLRSVTVLPITLEIPRMSNSLDFTSDRSMRSLPPLPSWSALPS